jgi:hypothetical protein
MLALVIVLTLIELTLNYVYIEVKRVDLSRNDKTMKFPNHYYNTIIRAAVVAGVFVFGGWSTGFVFSLLAALIGWPLFHYGLNLVRGKELGHLGKNAIDQFLQKIDNKTGIRNRITTHLLMGLLSVVAYDLWKSLAS